jgi:predicted PurR-regulated permease PerM
MNRKEFLKDLWRKFFKPLLILAVLIYSVMFLIKIFTQNGTERFIAILIIGLVILSALSYLLGFVFKNLINKIKSRLSEKSLRFVNIIGKIINYLLPIALGMLIYHSWQENNTSAIEFFGAILIFQIVDIVRKEKPATTKATHYTDNQQD